MNLLVCLAVLSLERPDGKGKIVVYNMRALTSTCLKIQDETERWQIHPEFQRYVFKRRATWMRLQRGTGNDAGNVWILEEQHEEKKQQERESFAGCIWRAWKGTYKINVDADDDELLHLNLLLLRRYIGHGRRRDRAKQVEVEWEVDTHFECKALAINIPLVEHAVPDRKIQMTFAAAVCVDKQGHQAHERPLPVVAHYPVKEKGKKLWADFICLGTELKAQPDRDALKLFTLPPGFNPTVNPR